MNNSIKNIADMLNTIRLYAPNVSFKLRENYNSEVLLEANIVSAIRKQIFDAFMIMVKGKKPNRFVNKHVGDQITAWNEDRTIPFDYYVPGGFLQLSLPGLGKRSAEVTIEACADDDTDDQRKAEISASMIKTIRSAGFPIDLNDYHDEVNDARLEYERKSMILSAVTE